MHNDVDVPKPLSSEEERAKIHDGCDGEHNVCDGDDSSRQGM